MKNIIPDNVSKHTNVYDVLEERGFIEQTTDAEAIRELLKKEKIRFYIGFDPTADCLHVGHFMQVIIMMYMQKYGHTPIVLIGEGTGFVGDPSGRTDMRLLMDPETLRSNGNQFKKLFEKFLEFDEEWMYLPGEGVNGKGHENKTPEEGKAISVNNISWLLPLNYLAFVRDIGTHFTVNSMLRADCFKNRLGREGGLSFFEFNYMLMQSYDFMVMARDIDCKMQFGGNDQWSNLIGGVELTRRKLNQQVYAMTFALLTTSDGRKMGKTQKGALWLEAHRTSPYEFFQYWRNVDDADVNKCLRMLTFLPMEEVNRLSAFEGSKINEAKEVLAFEITKLVHGEEEAQKALEGARAAFGGGESTANMPTTKMSAADFEGEGIGVAALIKSLGLVSSNAEGFRTIEQGGLVINDEKIVDTKLKITLDMFKDDKLIIRRGKKKYHVIEV